MSETEIKNAKITGTMQELMDANESFEKAAKAFEKATGKLMPGKDVGSAWPGEEWEEERQHEFKIWCAAVEYMRGSTTIEVKAEKLDIKDDDIIVLTTPRGLNMEEFEALGRQLPKDKHNIFIVLQTGDKLSAIPEADMAVHGWYRKEK